MNVGLPGTGIGGFYYMLCVLLMPVIEILKTARGKSSWKEWMLVLRQVCIGAGILFAVWLTGVVVKYLIPASRGTMVYVSKGGSETLLFLKYIYYFPFIVLLGVIVFSAILTRLMRK